MEWRNFFCKDEKPLEHLLFDGGFCGIFRTIGCVGDSLSSGEFQIPNEEGDWAYYDIYEYSWGQFMARTIGSKVYNFSRGGMTAKEYMESFAEANDFWNPDKACQAYIIALGVNDIIYQDMELGSVADIAEDYHNNKKTFAGYYASIVQRLKEIQPDAKFFFMTMLKWDDEVKDAKTNRHAQFLYELANTFKNCYVMDFCKYAPVQDAEYQQKFWLNGHLNPCGYVLTAKMIMSYIDYIIRHNITDFEKIGFVGRDR